MKRLLIAAAFAALAAPAGADVSEDLKFCGARKSAPERLACFEAVTRGASNPMPSRTATRAVSTLDAQAVVPTKAPVFTVPPARNQFDGYYAAIGGGYGVGSGRDSFVSGNLTTAGLPQTASLGPNLSIAVGRNIAIGWGIVGVELDARWSEEKAQETKNNPAPFFLVQSGNQVFSYAYTNDAGAHASLRLGATFDDLLIFAKAGVGVTHVRERFTADERGLVANFGGLGGFGSATTASWLPSAIFGVGVEKNWGSVFARFSADLEAFNHATSTATGAAISGSSTASQIMWTTRGTALIGVRF